VLAETKKTPQGGSKGSARFRKYFPPGYSQEQMETIIAELLSEWQAKQTGATAQRRATHHNVEARL